MLLGKVKKYSKKIAIVLIIAMVSAMGTSCSKSKNDQPKGTESSSQDKSEPNEESAIIKVGDYSYTLEDMMYHIYYEEELGWACNDFYQNLGGFVEEDYNYWETEEQDDESENYGKTGSEVAKESILLAVKKELVWYQEALKRGITLDDEDKKAAQTEYDAFLADLSDAQKNMPGMGTELLSLFEKQQVIEKYKEYLLEEANFQEDKVAEKISKEENRAYVFEYLEIAKEDDEGNSYSDKELKEYKSELNKIAKKIDKKSNMEQLIPEKYKDVILYSDESISESDEDYYGIYNDINIDEEIKKLKNGDISPVFETEYSYFVVRMKDDNSMEHYDEEVTAAIEAAKEEIYTTAYENVVNEYSIALNEDAWNDISIGNIIYPY